MSITSSRRLFQTQNSPLVVSHIEPSSNANVDQKNQQTAIKMAASESANNVQSHTPPDTPTLQVLEPNMETTMKSKITLEYGPNTRQES